MKLFFLCTILFISCGRDSTAGAGTTSETQNAEIKLTRPNVPVPLAKQDIAWAWQVNDSLVVSLGYINEAINDSLLNEKSNWFLENSVNLEITLSKLLSEVDVKKLEVDLVSSDSISLKLIYVQNDTTYNLYSELKIKLPRNGLTWVFGVHDPVLQTLYTSCTGSHLDSNNQEACRVVGVSSCNSTHPILCSVSENWNRPAYGIVPTSVVGEAQGYTQGWGGAKFALSQAVMGANLTSQSRGDELCQAEYGLSAKMATDTQSLYHPEMSPTKWVEADFANNLDSLSMGGRGYWIYMEKASEVFATMTLERFWVAQTANTANCWDL